MRRVGAVLVAEEGNRLVGIFTGRDAMRLFENCGFRHLPICRDGRVCSIVSRYDFRAREHARMNEETRFFEVLR